MNIIRHTLLLTNHKIQLRTHEKVFKVGRAVQRYVLSNVSFILIFCASSCALSQTEANTNTASKEQHVKIQECIDTGKTNLECKNLELENLKRINSEIDREVHRELTTCKPQLFGYDYKKSAQNYADSRKFFEKYTTAFCSANENVYGSGTGIAAAVMDCRLELRRLSISRSSQLLEKIRDNRSSLEQLRHGQNNDKLSIICK
jgi:hypothetical protein